MHQLFLFLLDYKSMSMYYDLSDIILKDLRLIVIDNRRCCLILCSSTDDNSSYLIVETSKILITEIA